MSLMFKMYQKAGSSRLFRVHPNGRVEVSHDDEHWHKAGGLNPKLINLMRKRGEITKLPNRDGRDLVGIQREIDRLNQCLMYADFEHLEEFIPVAHNGTRAYERVSMQTRQVSMADARGYDCWSEQDGLRIINQGLGQPITKMTKRRVAMDKAVNLLALELQKR